jgi:Mg2+/Co2+ transporter CorB
MDKLAIAEIMREPWFVPETTSLKDQLAAFLKRKTHFALVVDEYGALEGLVTLEDILEEIVGEIEDEYDVDDADLKPLPDGAVSVDGVVTIRELNRAMNWDLPDDEAVTVAGLLINQAQTIPKVGQTFAICGHQVRVTGRKGNQITRLEIGPPARRRHD